MWSHHHERCIQECERRTGSLYERQAETCRLLIQPGFTLTDACSLLPTSPRCLRISLYQHIEKPARERAEGHQKHPVRWPSVGIRPLQINSGAWVMGCCLLDRLYVDVV